MRGDARWGPTTMPWLWAAGDVVAEVVAGAG
uniref:Uncharacterized protein n=1 Tax=Setaria viridis TaxID=4556 RepID=A0A4V6D9U7_SETVI|nr:hypothetical protein SEVIR_3G225650v2 [Setaria viridis]